MLDMENVIAWLTEISLRPCDFATDYFDAYETEHLANKALEICEAAKVFNEQRNDALAMLKELKEQKVKTGYWIDSAGNDKCSICGEEYSDLYPDYGNTHFCPNCGAKMEGR